MRIMLLICTAFKLELWLFLLKVNTSKCMCVLIHKHITF